MKTSKLPWAQATFHLTKSEWTVLAGKPHAVIHLWSLDRQNGQLAVVKITEIAQHVPEDQGLGKWQEVLIPFRLWKAEVTQPIYASLLNQNSDS